MSEDRNNTSEGSSHVARSADPMSETYWDLLQAIAWIYTRDIETVASLIQEEWGYLDVSLGELEESIYLSIERWPAANEYAAMVSISRDELFRSLTIGKLEASGIWQLEGQELESYPKVIPPVHWKDCAMRFSGGVHVAHGDLLSNKGLWRSVLVLRDHVMLTWPPVEPENQESAETPQPREPGRPNVSYLAVLELEARAKRGELHDTLAAESRYLSNWLAKTRPDLRPLTPKTIENRCRKPFRVLKHREKPTPQK